MLGHMPAAIELGPGIWRVPTTPWDLVNSFLIRSVDGAFTLVDTGLASAPPRVLAALAEVGAGPGDVSTIVLTHAHPDHAGGAAALAGSTGQGMTVHHDDAQFVRQGIAPPRDESLRLGRLLRRMSSTFGAAPVAATMTDGQLLPGSGLRVHHTPGHTPGHCSLLHEPSGTLITGDSIWNMRSRRTWPALAFCTNAGQTEQTAATLADLEYATAAFTHGPEIRGSGREAVREFLAHPRRFMPGI
jgi:glyoxylase-like metal-dependent hydrolase (beta-lactamase superfamily II)